MKQYLIVLFGVIANMVYSQNVSFEISGIITDINKEPLESATVYLQNPKDSTTVSYTISDKKGRFLLKGNTGHNKLNFFVSYLGYKTYYKEMLMDGKLKTLDTIVLEENTNELDEILIKSTAPVTIKQDTIEFHAKSFKTRINANVEDLLKKFPGVEVTRDGAITVNGKQVDKIMVNGKPFFLDDPTIATRGLRSAVIEKVQVVDSRTEAEVFTGEPGERLTKTLNLQIKEEFLSQIFGDMELATDADKSFRFKGMFNQIKDKQQLSLVSRGNYANLEILGDEIPELNNPNGLQTKQNHNANYSNELFKGADLRSTYGYNYGKNINANHTQREYVLPESSYFSRSSKNNYSSNYGHRGKINFKIQPSKSVLINFSQNYNIGENNQQTVTTEKSVNPNGSIINESSATNRSVNTTFNYSNTISISKKFKRQENFLGLSISKSNPSVKGYSLFDSEIDVFGENPYSEIRKQRIDKEQNRNGLRTRIHYNQPISKSNKLSMNLAYNVSNNKNENKALAYDFNETTQAYDSFNTDVSTNLVYKEQTHEPVISLRYRNPETFILSGSLQLTHKILESNNQLMPNLSLKRSFNSIDGFLKYSENKPTRIKEIGLQRITQVPSLDQVQPFSNVDNPLNTVVGNPELSPTFSNDISVNWTELNLQKGTQMRFRVNGYWQEQAIISKTTVDDNLISTTTYVNVNGNYGMSANASLYKNFTVAKQYKIKLGMQLQPSLVRDINFNNETRYKLTKTALNFRPEFRLNWQDDLEFRANYNLAFTKSKFSLNGLGNTEFINHRANIDAYMAFNNRLEIFSNVAYSYNPQIGAGFKKDLWLWNGEVSYTLFNNRAQVSLELYDLLGQNNNASTTVTSNYIEDTQSTVLSQYAFLGFKWNIGGNGKSI